MQGLWRWQHHEDADTDPYHVGKRQCTSPRHRCRNANASFSIWRIKTANRSSYVARLFGGNMGIWRLWSFESSHATTQRRGETAGRQLESRHDSSAPGISAEEWCSLWRESGRN